MVYLSCVFETGKNAAMNNRLKSTSVQPRKPTANNPLSALDGLDRDDGISEAFLGLAFSALSYGVYNL